MKNILEIALAEYGVKEISGPTNNPRILEYANACGKTWVKDEGASWCGLFLGYCVTKAGITPPEKMLVAREWLKFGEETKTPKIGDIAVLWRESVSSWKGHVGIYIREDSNGVYLLGGNQGNKVCIEYYPKKRILGYRTF